MCLCHQTVQLGLVESDGSLPLGLYHSSHLLLADRLEAGISSNACTEYARPPHFNNNDNNNNEANFRQWQNFNQRVIRDSNPDCWINPDPDVSRISPKVLSIYYLVGVGH